MKTSNTLEVMKRASSQDLSPECVAEFRSAFFADVGRDLSVKEAEGMAKDVLDFLLLLYPEPIELHAKDLHGSIDVTYDKCR